MSQKNAFDEASSDLRKVFQDFTPYINKSLNENKSLLEDTQSSQWEKRGTGGDNKLIKPSPSKDYDVYSKGYERLKKSLGLNTKFVDLKLSGDLYNNIGVDIEGVDINIDSDVSYMRAIDDYLYYKDIWGYDNVSIEELRDSAIVDDLVSEINKKL